MRVLIDTNVLFSALLTDGPERELLRVLTGQGDTLVLTETIIEELKRNVAQKYPLAARSRALAIIEVMISGDFIKLKGHREYTSFMSEALTLINKKDAPILAVALGVDIDVFVTGDKDFLANPKLRFLRGRKIFKPRELLNKI